MSWSLDILQGLAAADAVAFARPEVRALHLALCRSAANLVEPPVPADQAQEAVRVALAQCQAAGLALPTPILELLTATGQQPAVAQPRISQPSSEPVDDQDSEPEPMA